MNNTIYGGTTVTPIAVPKVDLTDLDLAVKTSMTTNQLEWTDEEKAAARDLIGAVGSVNSGGSVRFYGVNRSGKQTLYYGADTDLTFQAGRIAMYVNDNNSATKEPLAALNTKIPATDYQCANKKYVDEVNKENANAINVTRMGETISLTNISPIKHNVGVKVSSKNLVSYVPDFTPLIEAGLTVTDNGDGTYMINGQTSKSIDFIVFDNIEVEVGETYRLEMKNDGPTWAQISGESGNFLGEAGIPFIATESKIKCTAIFGEGYPYENYLFAPQVEKGSVITPFTPYVETEDIKLLKPSKNLLHFEPHTEVIEGLTVTYGDDGTISLNGKLPDEYGSSQWSPFYPVATFEIPLDKNANYVIKPVLEGKQSSNIHIMVQNSKGNEMYRWYKGETPYMKISNQEKITLLICPITYQTYTNESCQIQVEAGVKPTDFEKGTVEEYIPDENGVIEGIESTPNMTLTASEGAVIEVDYKVDTKTYIDEKFNELAAQIV